MGRLVVALVTGLLVFAGHMGLAQEEGIYQIKNRHSGKLLAVDGKGAKIIQDTAKKTGTQWKLVKTGEYYQIAHPKSGKVVTAPPNPLKEGEGTQATLEKDSGGNNQQWTLVEVKVKGATYYVIKSRTEGMVLDVDNASEDAGARVILWKLNPKGDRANQQWSLVPTK